jgi:hypothetical protein
MSLREPNQYHTPCRLVYFNENNTSTKIGIFDDLQEAYLYVKSTAGRAPWVLMPWEEVIEKLLEYHLEDKSGCDVSKNGRLTYTIYYNCD